MSWFSQRWRTQRNAIRNVNCKTQWIIKILNANCASWLALKHVSLRISSLPIECVAYWTVYGVDGVRNLTVVSSLVWSCQSCSARSAFGVCSVRRCCCKSDLGWTARRASSDVVSIHNVGNFTSVKTFVSRIDSVSCVAPSRLILRSQDSKGNTIFILPISNETRRPAEFKHIIRRRKRN